MNKHITAFDLDLIIMAALRWNISSRSGNPENTRQFLRANWQHPHIVRKHWLYFEDLERDTRFWERVDGNSRQEWLDFRAMLASQHELPPRRLNRKIRSKGIGLLSVDALNYTLGRASYMPGVMITFLRDNWLHPELQQQQETILATIREWLDRTKAGPIEVYVLEWQALYNKLKNSNNMNL